MQAIKEAQAVQLAKEEENILLAKQLQVGATHLCTFISTGSHEGHVVHAKPHPVYPPVSLRCPYPLLSSFHCIASC